MRINTNSKLLTLSLLFSTLAFAAEPTVPAKVNTNSKIFLRARLRIQLTKLVLANLERTKDRNANLDRDMDVVSQLKFNSALKEGLEEFIEIETDIKKNGFEYALSVDPSDVPKELTKFTVDAEKEETKLFDDTDPQKDAYTTILRWARVYEFLLQ